MNNVIVVCEYGWVLCGEKKTSDTNKLVLENASVVRKWNNGRGIGGLAKAEYKAEYMLDHIGGVEVQVGKILFTIPCEW